MWNQGWQWFIRGVKENWPPEEAQVMEWLCGDNWGRAAVLVMFALALLLIGIAITESIA